MTPLPQAVPGTELVVWRARPGLVTVCSTERWPEWWASFCPPWGSLQTLAWQEALRDSPGPLGTPASSLWTEPQASHTSVFPSYKAGRGPHLDGSVPCSPEL